MPIELVLFSDYSEQETRGVYVYLFGVYCRHVFYLHTTFVFSLITVMGMPNSLSILYDTFLLSGS
jgi:hypothetical protein